MKENFGKGWVDRGPRRVTDYDDQLSNVGKHWSFTSDERADAEDGT